MPRPCTICQHPSRPAIEEALRGRVQAKESYRVIAIRFAISRDALFRHDSEHRIAQPIESQALTAPKDATPMPSAEPRHSGTPTTKLDTDALKRTMVSRWKAKEEQILTALTPDKIATMGGRDLSVAGGICADKVMRLTGLDRQESEGLVLRIPARLMEKYALAVQIKAPDGAASSRPVDIKAQESPGECKRV